MLEAVKRILFVLLIAYLLYYLFVNPEGAASAVRGFFGLFRSLGTFFSELAAG